jgi:trans-aconitate methyltransferase
VVMSALQKASKPLDALTADDPAPVDHFHARGFQATVALGDRLPIESYHHIPDIGCGLGGPVRYFAQRGAQHRRRLYPADAGRLPQATARVLTVCTALRAHGVGSRLIQQ